MSKGLRLKIFTATGILFVLVCSWRITSTFQKDKEEAIFESVMLTAFVGYHGYLLRSLQQQPE